MPIMHRLACLRDDVIFFIFLYQRYKYRTDYTRVNEFGQCEEPTEEMLADREETTNESSILEKSEAHDKMQEVAGGGFVEASSAPAASSSVGVRAENNSSGNIRRRRGAREKK